MLRDTVVVEDVEVPNEGVVRLLGAHTGHLGVADADAEDEASGMAGLDALVGLRDLVGRAEKMLTMPVATVIVSVPAIRSSTTCRSAGGDPPAQIAP